MNKKSNHYTLMFIPENNGKTFTLRVHKYVVRSLIIFFVVFLICLSMLLYKSGEIATKLQLLYIVKLENEKLVIENNQLRQITGKLEKIETMYNYISKFANPPSSAQKKEISDSISVINEKKFETIFTDTINQSGNFIANTHVNQDALNSIPNILPVDGWITRQFTKSKDASHDLHQGVDYAATLGTPIKSSAPGIVQNIEIDPYLGLLITINHENGYISKYGHCSQVLITKHDCVKRGQTIALVGSTGRSTAPHLHYEVLKDGVNVDPMKYLLTSK